jgi:hypothetical protein
MSSGAPCGQYGQQASLRRKESAVATQTFVDLPAEELGWSTEFLRTLGFAFDELPADADATETARARRDREGRQRPFGRLEATALPED